MRLHLLFNAEKNKVGEKAGSIVVRDGEIGGKAPARVCVVQRRSKRV